jgi:hypothetical protein
MGGQPVAVDEEMPRVPAVVGKRLDDRGQPGNVRVEALGDAVDPTSSPTNSSSSSNRCSLRRSR